MSSRLSLVHSPELGYRLKGEEIRGELIQQRKNNITPDNIPVDVPIDEFVGVDSIREEMAIAPGQEIVERLGLLLDDRRRRRGSNRDKLSIGSDCCLGLNSVWRRERTRLLLLQMLSRLNCNGGIRRGRFVVVVVFIKTCKLSPDEILVKRSVAQTTTDTLEDLEQREKYKKNI